jgi:hypothetical protein
MISNREGFLPDFAGALILRPGEYNNDMPGYFLAFSTAMGPERLSGVGFCPSVQPMSKSIRQTTPTTRHSFVRNWNMDRLFIF